MAAVLVLAGARTSRTFNSPLVNRSIDVYNTKDPNWPSDLSNLGMYLYTVACTRFIFDP